MVHDKMGREIQEGSLIAYGVRSGNSGSLEVGVVDEITTQEHHYRGVTPLIYVMGIDDYNEPKPKSRRGRLEWTDRIVVLDGIPITEEWKKVIKQICS